MTPATLNLSVEQKQYKGMDWKRKRTMFPVQGNTAKHVTDKRA